MRRGICDSQMRAGFENEGAVYEAHIVTSDWTRATVYLDGDFKVTSTETGGPGGRMKG